MPELLPFRHSVAVIIGINQYLSSLPTLRTPVPDAEQLEQDLRLQHDYKTYLLRDKEATKHGIMEMLCHTLPSILTSENDRLLFYFAGHGHAVESDADPQGYLALYDSVTEDHYDSWLDMRVLFEALTTLKCRHGLIILDSCFSGAARWYSSTRRSQIERRKRTMYREHFDRFISCPAWQVITSTSHDQLALDALKDYQDLYKTGHHSPFADALLNGLRGAADMIGGGENYSSGDGVITAQELAAYICLNVENRVGKAKNHKQTPEIWPLLKRHDKGEYVFLVPGKETELPSAEELTERTNPYPGLLPYTKLHESMFFGRNNLIESLVQRVMFNNMTVVLGQSGIGKSSLVQAGLIPQLEDDNWEILGAFHPGSRPIQTLEQMLIKLGLPATYTYEVKCRNPISLYMKVRTLIEQANRSLIYFKEILKKINLKESRKKTKLNVDLFRYGRSTYALLQRGARQADNMLLKKLMRLSRVNSIYFSEDIASHQITKSLGEILIQDPDHISSLLKSWSLRNPDRKLLLVMDQLEEVITMCSKSEQDIFFQLLPYLLSIDFNIHTVLILRSDFEFIFYSLNPRSHRDFQEQWIRSRFLVTPMTQNELRNAIEEPAEKKAMYFKPDSLVDQITNDVIQMPGTLPLMSLTLSELYRKYLQSGRDDRALTREDYNSLGGITGLLRLLANEEYMKLLNQDIEYEKTFKNVILRMISISGGEFSRRKVPHSELWYKDEKENFRVNLLLENLIKSCLVVTNSKNDKQPFFELSHDSLIPIWNKILDWEEHIEFDIALQQEITLQVEKWQAATKMNHEKNVEEFLWDRSSRLEAFTCILNSEDNWLNCWEEEFIRKSINTKSDNKIEYFCNKTLIFLCFFSLVLNESLVSAELRNSMLAYVSNGAHNFFWSLFLFISFFFDAVGRVLSILNNVAQ